MNRTEPVSFRHIAALAAAACSLAFAAFPAGAGEIPPMMRHDIGAYALFGRSAVVWGGALVMPERSAVGSEAVVSFSAPTFAARGDSYVAAPWIQAAPGTQLHHVFTASSGSVGHATLLHPAATLVGPVVADADWPVAPAFDCGGTDVTVQASTSPLVLAPGRYGTVTVSQDQALELVAGGRYELCSLRVRNGASVRAYASNVILVRDYVSTGTRSRIGGEGACAARWIALGSTPSPSTNGAAFDFGGGSSPTNRALIEGQFFTPARIAMAQANDYVGRFWAWRIEGLEAEMVSRTLTDCDAGVCGDGVLDPGEACDDGNNRQGDCCSSFCEILAEGSPCDDGLFCTDSDRCDGAGSCLGSSDPCDAPDGDGDCSEACNEETDTCDGPDPDGASCNDGLFCNGADVCGGGHCGVHAGTPCPGPDGDANCRESCNEATDSCTALDPVGAPCNDGRFCTSVDTCDSGGSCVSGGSPCPGSDGDGDCAESCDELSDTCTAADAEASPCDDGLFCTSVDRCDGRGACLGWSDPCAGATADGDADCSESCDEERDECAAPDLDGSACEDGLACTLDERCIGGSCTPSGRTTCDDGNPCTDEFCAPDGSCLGEYNASPCDDGDACTTVDRCSRGVCTGGERVDCRDGDLCSADICDPADGRCHHPFAPADDCHVFGDGSTRIDIAYAPADGERTERLLTSWRSGHGDEPTLREDLGDPTIGDAFSVCFFDESGGLPELAYRLDLSPAMIGEGRWKKSWTASQLVYKLKAASGTAQGVSQVKLVVDRDGAPTFKLKAGANVGCSGECRDKFQPPLPLDDGRFFAMEPGMTVQWVSEAGACWSSRYEGASANTREGFYAISRTSRER